MVKLTAEQISRVFEIGNRITDQNDATLFFHALSGDYNAKANLALNSMFDKEITPRAEALFFLRDLDHGAVTA
jgi:hypothetical protein